MRRLKTILEQTRLFGRRSPPNCPQTPFQPPSPLLCAALGRLDCGWYPQNNDSQTHSVCTSPRSSRRPQDHAVASGAKDSARLRSRSVRLTPSPRKFNLLWGPWGISFPARQSSAYISSPRAATVTSNTLADKLSSQCPPTNHVYLTCQVIAVP